MGDYARHVAMLSIARQCKLFPDFDLTMPGRMVQSFQASGAMDPRDAALTHAIYDTVVRRWLTLEHIVQRYVNIRMKDLEPRLKGVLLCGAAQLVLLDRLPAHAVINQAVEWAKAVIRPGAGGLTNAVLRKVAGLVPEDRGSAVREAWTGRVDELPMGDGTALALSEAPLPDDEMDRLCVATSHTRWLLEQWERDRGADQMRALALHSLAVPPVVLTTRYAKSALDHPDLKPHVHEGSMVWEGSHNGLSELLRTRPDVWAQDSASAMPIGLLQDNPGWVPKVIYDLCAGQGTKTRQLAAAFPDAQIIATDVDPERLASLRQSFAGSAQVSVDTLKSIRMNRTGQADVVLLDVPCSNSGVLARRPEAKYRLDGEHIEALTAIQRQLIADTINLLRESPRGRILYSTCSLEGQENLAQVEWTDKWHSLGVARTHQHLPSGAPGGGASGYSDGSYAALTGGGKR